MSLLTVFAGSGKINLDPNQGDANLAKIGNIGDLIGAAVGSAFLIAFLLVFTMLVWGGIQWITSGGDKDNTQKARDRITHALVGLAVVAGAWALMKLVEFFFGINILGGFTLPSAAK